MTNTAPSSSAASTENITMVESPALDDARPSTPVFDDYTTIEKVCLWLEDEQSDEIFSPNLQIFLDSFTLPDNSRATNYPQLLSRLYALFNITLEQHSEKSGISQNLQLLLLQWVQYSCNQSVRLIELAAIISMELDIDLIEAKDKVRASCGPLLMVLHDETVQFVHWTFTSFLIHKGRTGGSPCIDEEGAHQVMALTCLKYLSTGEVSKLFAEDTYLPVEMAGGCIITDAGREGIIALRYQAYPLVHYAADFWPNHVEKSRDQGELYSMLDKFLTSDAFDPWLRTYWWPKHGYYDAPADFTPLHVAVYFRLPEYVKHILSQNTNIYEVEGNTGRDPLSYAASDGVAEILKLLLDAGADPNFVDKDGCSACHYAAQAGHENIIKLLVASGANAAAQQTVNTGNSFQGDPDTKGRTPLYYACSAGHAKAAVELLKYDQGGFPLCWAAEYGQAAVVQAVLDLDFSIESRHQGRTALHWAALEGDVESVKVLLTNGADHEALCERPDEAHPRSGRMNYFAGTILHAISQQEWSSRIQRLPVEICGIVEALIDGGADVNAKEINTSFTPIVRAASNSSREFLVRILLARGADPFFRDVGGASLLHFANSGHVIKMLVQAGVDINTVDDLGRNALFRNLGGWSRTNVILALLKEGIDVNHRDKNGDTALLFIRPDDVEPLTALIEAGADCNARNRNGQTVLHSLFMKEKSMEYLISVGADIEAVDYLGQTPLLTQAHFGNYAVVKILSQNGGNIHARDKIGRSVMHAVVRHRHSSPDSRGWEAIRDEIQLFKTVLRACGLVFPIDKDGNSIIHELVQMIRSQGANCIDGILEAILDVHPPSILHLQRNDGKTALHLAVCRPPDDIPANRALIERLLQSIEVADIKGRTPLHYAATMSEYHVSILLEKGASINALDYAQRSCLHFAARARQPNILMLLLDHDRSLLDHQDVYGDTALHDAVGSGNVESVKMLLRAGAKYLSSHDGQTPLQTTADYKDETMRWKRAGGSHVCQGPRPLLIEEVRDNARPCQYQWGHQRMPIPIDTESFCDIRYVVEFLVKSCLREISSENAAKYTKENMYNKLRQDKAVDELVSAIPKKSQKSPFDEPYLPFKFDQVQYAFEYGDEQTLVNSLDDYEFGFFHNTGNLSGSTLIHEAAYRGRSGLVRRLRKYVNHRDQHTKTVLHRASESPYMNCDMLLLLVELGADINATCDSSSLDISASALHKLAESRYYWQHKGLAVLLDRGAKINLLSEDGNTPLHDALSTWESFWYKEGAITLLKYNPDFNIRNNAGKTALDFAAKKDASIFKILLNRVTDGKLVLTTNMMQSALEGRNTEVLKMLLDAGGDANALDGSGRTPFVILLDSVHGETEQKHLDIADVLIQHGADPNIGTCQHGGLPIHRFARWFILPEVIQKFNNVNYEARDESSRTALMIACHEPFSNTKTVDDVTTRNFSKIQFMVEQGADTTAVNNSGETVLHLFFKGLRSLWGVPLEMIIEDTRFIATRVDINAKDNAGNLAMHIACSKYLQLVDILLEYGADVHLQDSHRNTLLHALSAFQFISKRDSNRMDEAESPMEIEEFYKRMVVTYELDVNAVNDDGETPVFECLRSWLTSSADDDNPLEYFKTLGTDMRHKNKKGQGLLHIGTGIQLSRWSSSRRDKCLEMFNILTKEDKLDPKEEDMDGKTPLDLASATDKRTILELFETR